MVKLALGTTKEGKPRKRREKLSPHVRKIEHNVYMHIKRDVRHTGRGWLPLFLDPAWDAAVKRMLKDGIIVEHSELGGYVPTAFVARMMKENNKVMADLTKKSGPKRKPVSVAAMGRSYSAALGRLVVAGVVNFDPEKGYTPLR